jgi:hypothetical protein
VIAARLGLFPARGAQSRLKNLMEPHIAQPLALGILFSVAKQVVQAKFSRVHTELASDNVGVRLQSEERLH